MYQPKLDFFPQKTNPKQKKDYFLITLYCKVDYPDELIRSPGNTKKKMKWEVIIFDEIEKHIKKERKKKRKRKANSAKYDLKCHFVFFFVKT